MKKYFALLAVASLFAVSCGKTKPTDTDEPKSFSVSPTTDISFTADGGSATIKVESNLSWTVECDNSAFSVSPSSGKDNGQITVSVPANSASTEVKGVVSVIPEKVTGLAGASIKTVKINVIQAAAEIVVPDPPTPPGPDPGSEVKNPQSEGVLAEWEFATEPTAFFEVHFAYELAKVDGKPNPDAHLPGYVSDDHYCESNIVPGGKIRFWNGSDKTALDDNGRCKRGTGNYGEPCWYGAWKGDVVEFEAVPAAPYDGVKAGTKLHIFFAVRPNTQNTLKYWLLEIKDGSEWVALGNVKTAAVSGEEVKYNVELIYNPEGKGMDGDNYPEVPQQINTFVDETYTLTADVSKVEYRLTCQSLMIADGSMVVSYIGETSASKAQNSVVRFAGKDSNSGGAHPVEQHTIIEIVK